LGRGCNSFIRKVSAAGHRPDWTDLLLAAVVRLADEAPEDALYVGHALRGFAGIDLNHDPVLDATTTLKFRHWLERHELTRALFRRS
jgi:IS5 family transposase